MSVRSGEIEPFTDADEVEALVGHSSNLDKNTAHEPLATVRRLLSAPNIDRSFLEVNGTAVIIHLPAEPDKASAIRDDVEGLGLTTQVIFLSEPTLSPLVHEQTRRRAGHLF